MPVTPKVSRPNDLRRAHRRADQKERQVSVQSDGLEQFQAEVRRRGGTAVPRAGREALIDISAPDGGRYLVKLKTKQRGD